MHLGNDHPKITEILYRIGLVHQSRGEFIKALNAFNQAMKMVDVENKNIWKSVRKVDYIQFNMLEESDIVQFEESYV